MNSFFGLGPMELLVIIFLALIVLGPQRLPGTIREVMKYWRYFRNLSGELTSQLGEEFKDLEDLNPQRMLEDLAKELDDEVEQTKEAASLKKKPASKNAAKSSSAKTSTAKSASSETKSSTSSSSKEKAAESTATEADSSRSAAAAVETEEAPVAAASEDAVDGDTVTTVSDDSSNGSADETVVEHREVDATGDRSEPSEVATKPDPATASAAAQAALQRQLESGKKAAAARAEREKQQAEAAAASQAVAQNGDSPSTDEAVNAADGPGDPSATSEENTILPPERAPSDDVVEPAATTEEDPVENGAVPEDDASEGGVSQEGATGDDLHESDNDSSPTTKKRVGSAEPAPVSVNGKSARPEDEG